MRNTRLHQPVFCAVSMNLLRRPFDWRIRTSSRRICTCTLSRLSCVVPDHAHRRIQVPGARRRANTHALMLSCRQPRNTKSSRTTTGARFVMAGVRNWNRVEVAQRDCEFPTSAFRSVVRPRSSLSSDRSCYTRPPQKLAQEPTIYWSSRPRSVPR